MTSKGQKLLVGAHTSAAGGAYKALLNGAAIGATTIQLFTSNQKTWAGKVISEALEKGEPTQEALWSYNNLYMEPPLSSLPKKVDNQYQLYHQPIETLTNINRHHLNLFQE